MTSCLPRRTIGSALTAFILAGCSSRSPFANDVPELQHLEARSAPSPPPAGDPDPPQGDLALPALDEDSLLDDYLRYAALKNPGLEAAFQQWKAAVERLPQVRALPDPRFTYGYYIAEVETRVGPMQHAIALSQTFPWLGKLQDREDAAARAANVQYQRFEAAKLDLFYRVEDAYNDLFLLKRSIDIAGENIELLGQFEGVARARYRVGAAGHPDVIRVQVELAKLEDRLRQLGDLRAPRTARLNAALNRRPDAAVAWPSAVSGRVTDKSIDDLLAILREHNPHLEALDEETERERINADIARKDGLPDLTVGLAYTVIGERNGVSIAGNGDDAFLASLSVNVPLWREKYDAGVREAIARRLAVVNQRVEMTNRLTADLQQAIFEHNDARRRVELYRDTLIPKATESLQASLAGFQQGTADFLDLVDTERTLLEFQLGLERALVDRATSCAQIERLVGATVGSVPNEPQLKETHR
ncbi:MAG: TolC family protein, partial [Phycisphaerales bacterium]